ncbi:MAG: DUF115 domain-containing protein [Euryarchaeota archaeon]|nr:DUF115 domain-containing protein [Euryarchaeota archaeon]
MEIQEWMSLYRKIESDFQYPRENEYLARDTLSRIIGERVLSKEDIARYIGKKVYVAGNASSLETEWALIDRDCTVIAADDAAVFLYDRGILPDLVMTDLDGDVQKLMEIPAIFGIHAHGDNVSRLHFAEDFDTVFGTTQVEPAWNVYNFGGFTDGDRAVFLAAHFGAEVHLVGFDFDAPRVVAGKDPEIKRKKLRWAKYLIDYLRAHGASIVWEKLKS